MPAQTEVHFFNNTDVLQRQVSGMTSPITEQRNVDIEVSGLLC